MKTQEQIKKEIKTLNEMGNTETVRWIQARPDHNGDWKTWSNVPLDDAKKMITYCINNKIDFAVDFEHKED